ncbi:sensor domain-containing diguanylate cyclase [Solirubrobacter phytolaccae]|uniref:Sensor domain-containing diguanylate cyclase n=1 Tax=Solirubrobacter phytolaccae TaxID=1404360 RepID=A0A9X3NRA4_9ACTN|nr:sensor domain-containing diguanylate cyclase [Solirubrobacter phytolaccae]MDA0185757.1 sensor domain-containing diguanylate cyclase [Solirubrobacter phytolaccae]
MTPTDSAAARRLRAIERLHALDRAGDPALTALTRVASFVVGGGAAAVHLIDDEVQHRVAATDAPLGEHPREDSMCKLVVDGERRIVCEDATADSRFAYSSFVQGDAPVRFYASTPVRATDGTVVGSLCTWDIEAREIGDEHVRRLEDLAEQVATLLELRQVASELGHAASHDPLTGVLNRTMLDDRLAHAFARRMRRDCDVLVVVVDLDGFKAINDTLGHDTGDVVLKTVASRLQTATRAEDTVARLGGDEFAVVAELQPDSDGESILVARIESGLSEPAEYGGELRPLRASVGAALAEPGDDVRAALARADQAMYARKRERR